DRQRAQGAALALALLVGSWILVVAAAAWRRRRGGPAVSPVPPHRAEGRKGRHSAAADVDTGAPVGLRPGRLLWRITAVATVVAWLVPALGVVVTALRPSADAESSGWWTFVRDPSVDLSSVRTVLGEGMWSGVAISAASAIAVAVVSALLGGRLSARLGGRA